MNKNYNSTIPEGYMKIPFKMTDFFKEISDLFERLTKLSTVKSKNNVVYIDSNFMGDISALIFKYDLSCDLLHFFRSVWEVNMYTKWFLHENRDETKTALNGKVDGLEELKKRYGSNITLGEIFEKMKGEDNLHTINIGGHGYGD